MNRNEFIQKWEKKINECKQLCNEQQSICRKTKKSTLEYKNAYRKSDEWMVLGSILQIMLDDFKSIQ